MTAESDEVAEPDPIRRARGVHTLQRSRPCSARVRDRVPDALGLLWVVVAAGAAMTPALSHGWSLGNYDLQTLYGGLAQRGARVHYLQGSDQLTLFMPLTNLVWTQVHHGHLPLWNPYSALGMPLAFNWESAPLSVPALLGYLVPVHLAYTAQVLVTYAIAGIGVYVLGRTLRLGALGCAMAATVYELSGPIFALVGWSFGGVMAWAGWLFAGAVLIIRGGRRLRSVALFSVALACAVYAGEPEAVVFLGITVGILALVIAGSRLRQFGGAGPILRPVVDLAVAGVIGVALSAPLVLPGTQVGALSLRNFRGGQVSLSGPSSAARALPLRDLVHVLFQGFDGLPVIGNQWFADRYIYFDTVAYVGVIAVVLAVLALAMRWREPEVLAFGAIAVLMAAFVFATPVVAVLDNLPSFLRGILWYRALAPMAFALSVLAGVGTDAVVRQGTTHRARMWIGAAFGGMGLILMALWLFGRGNLLPAQVSVRDRSFIWPVAETVLGIAIVAGLAFASRRGRRTQRGTWAGTGAVAAAALLACETVFLVTAGSPIWASSPRSFEPPTAAVAQLQRSVGSALVGFGTGACGAIGITPDVNAAYGVRELAVYDPVIPLAYFNSWKAETGQLAGPPGGFTYCPTITTATIARRYGVGYVLEQSGLPGPSGAVFDRMIGDEDLYRIPGAALATLTNAPEGGGIPGPDAPGQPLAVTHPDPASWRVSTGSARAAILRLRLTNLPGWRASIDGRPLRLLPYSGVMLQARIPQGDHVIRLTYWPQSLTLGLVLAVSAATGLGAALVVAGVGRRRARSRLAGNRG